MIPNADAAKRLAKLDAEKYGWAKVHAQGTRERPLYTDMVALPLQTDVGWKDRLKVEERFHKLTSGSHLALLQLADSKQDSQELLSATKEIVQTYAVGLYVFNRNLVFCASCKKTFYGMLGRCPSCRSVNMLNCFSRVSAKHLPSSLWSPAKRSAVSQRASYVLISD